MQAPHANLVTAATANFRKPYLWVRADLARAGWLDAGYSNWIDITAFTDGVTLDSMATDVEQGITIIGQTVAGSGVLTLRNENQKFSPHGAGLYSNYTTGGMALKVPVIVNAGFYYSATGYHTRAFSGYITRFTESSDGSQVVCQLQDRSLDLLPALTESVMYIGDYPDTYIQRMVDELAAAIRPTTVLDRGLFPIPFAWRHKESPWEELEFVAVSQAGLVYFNKDGALVFRDGTYMARVANCGVTINAPLRSANEWDLSQVYNDIQMSWQGGVLMKRTEVWAADCPIRLLPAEAKTVKAQLRMPCYEVATPVVTKDYRAVSLDGQVKSSGVTVALTAYAQSATAVLTNTAAMPVDVTWLRLQGSYLDLQDGEMIEYEDSESQSNYGKRSLSPRCDYVQSRQQAETCGMFFLDRHKDPRALYTVDAPLLPWLEVGDRITAVEPITGLNEDFFIMRMQQVLKPQSELMRMNLTLLRRASIVPYTDWFIVGTTAVGTAGRYFY